jgi:single-stranded-DNA-specific exonuclease
VDTPEIHFRLAPRINAAGRLGDAHAAVRLFISQDEPEARLIATHLDELNSKRQRIEEKTLAEAREMIGSFMAEGDRKSFVLASADWHPGVIGIVAARLAEEYQRPTILIALAKDMGKGSGRSLDSFSIYQGLHLCQNWIEKFGGHEQAAGLVIRSEQVSGFSQAFEEIVSSCSPVRDSIPRLFIDSFAQLDQMDESFFEDLRSLAPFGLGNPEPVIGIENVAVLDSKLVGKGHIRYLIRDDFMTREAIGFGLASSPPPLQKRMKMALTPQINFFRGKRILQFKVVDLQPITLNL